MLTLVQPGIDQYAMSKSEPMGALLDELVAETNDKMKFPQMLSGHLEGRFLKMMVLTSQAKNILEIGMFTGYSALCMAEGLPDDGCITTLEIDPVAIAIAKKYFAKSEHGRKISVVEGPALSSIEKLKGPFDFVFIDADKPNYSNYYKAVLPKLKSGGIIMIDNVLWSGKVLDPKDETDFAITALNDLVAKDDSVNKVLLTVRDGLFFVRKK
ncbi:MAG: class I SAM-dependent methyltransferase [Candidatus Obscuribacterales bacterium]|nr:class I SAM-dependent methyltransferase [Candidatus Obscuribacterales bacterium]